MSSSRLVSNFKIDLVEPREHARQAADSRKKAEQWQQFRVHERLRQTPRDQKQKTGDECASKNAQHQPQEVLNTVLCLKRGQVGLLCALVNHSCLFNVTVQRIDGGRVVQEAENFS